MKLPITGDKRVVNLGRWGLFFGVGFRCDGRGEKVVRRERVAAKAADNRLITPYELSIARVSVDS